MRFYRKIMVAVIIGLFIGTGIVQNVSCSNTEKYQIIVPMVDSNSLLLKERSIQREKMNEVESKSTSPSFSNSPPSTPTKLVGPTKGIVNIFYPYHTSSVDPDGDLIQYGIDHNYDNIINDEHWTKYYYLSGEIVTIDMKFTTPGIYPLRVKARDIHGAESDWSEPLQVNLQKTKLINHPFLNFLENILQDHSHLLSLMMNILNT